jgi:polysaccharide transporter, PST family
LKPSNFKFPFLSRKLSDENKPLFANFFSLGLIQVINFLLSIITFPYIVRVVGIEYFGLITVAQAVMTYFTVITDYGFNLSATKDISINRGNKASMSSIFSEVMATKAFLLLGSACMLALAIFYIPAFNAYSVLMLYSFPIVIGQLLQPIWFFQGIEKMKYITYINMFSKALYAIGVFTLINEPGDYLLLNLINGASGIVGGIISCIIVFHTFNVDFRFTGLKQIRKQLAEGWSIFLSTITITIATNSNILILGIFASPLILGFYSIAEKVFLIMRTFAVILYQVVYPRICLLAQQPFQLLAKFLKRIFQLILLIFIPLALAVFLLADFIVFLVAGEYHNEAALVLRIVCFAPLMAALNIPVAQTMLALRFNRTYATIMSIGAVANVILNFLLASKYQAIGTAWSILITESLITGLLYLVFYKKYPQYSFFSRSAII